MAITGDLVNFPLPEVFKFIEHQQGTGLLSIYTPASTHAQQKKVNNYVWLQQGRIVAVADRLDGLGLVYMIGQRGWVSPQEIAEVLTLCPLPPIGSTGLLLKEKGVLTPEQLKLLFYVQVLRPVCSLFELQSGHFAFDSMAECPWQEMTGLSLSGTLATLLGLRVLRDWTSLTDKLPSPSSILSQVSSGKPNLKLDSQEWQVWKCMDGKRSVQAIAKYLTLSIRTVQQIAYRLSMVGLLEEVSIMPPTIDISTTYTVGKHKPSDRATGFLEVSPV